MIWSQLWSTLKTRSKKKRLYFNCWFDCVDLDRCFGYDRKGQMAKTRMMLIKNHFFSLIMMTPFEVNMMMNGCAEEEWPNDFHGRQYYDFAMMMNIQISKNLIEYLWKWKKNWKNLETSGQKNFYQSHSPLTPKPTQNTHLHKFIFGGFFFIPDHSMDLHNLDFFFVFCFDKLLPMKLITQWLLLLIFNLKRWERWKKIIIIYNNKTANNNNKNMPTNQPIDRSTVDFNQTKPNQTGIICIIIIIDNQPAKWLSMIIDSFIFIFFFFPLQHPFFFFFLSFLSGHLPWPSSSSSMMMIIIIIIIINDWWWWWWW